MNNSIIAIIRCSSTLTPIPFVYGTSLGSWEVVYNLFQRYFKQERGRFQDKKNTLLSRLESLETAFSTETGVSAGPPPLLMEDAGKKAYKEGWMVRKRMNQAGGATAQVLLLHLSSLMWDRTRSLTQQTGRLWPERGGNGFLVCVQVHNRQLHKCKAASEGGKNKNKNRTQRRWALVRLFREAEVGRCGFQPASFVKPFKKIKSKSTDWWY